MVAWNKRIQLASKWTLLGYIRQEVLFDVPTTKHKNSLILKTLASVQTPHLASKLGGIVINPVTNSDSVGVVYSSVPPASLATQPCQMNPRPLYLTATCTLIN